MSFSTALQVPFGPYFGFTLPELEDELARYKVARQTAGGDLQTASVNGQNYGFSQVRRDWTLDQWQQALMEAIYYLDPGRYPFKPGQNAAVVSFV